MRHKEINLSDVKRMLARYVVSPPSEQYAREMLECYAELSPESQNEISNLVHQIVLRMRNGFGVLNALELIGALMKEGYL